MGTEDQSNSKYVRLVEFLDGLAESPPKDKAELEQRVKNNLIGDTEIDRAMRSGAREFWLQWVVSRNERNERGHGR